VTFSLISDDEPQDQGIEALAGLVQARTGLGWGPQGRAKLRRGVEARIKALALGGAASYLGLIKEDQAEWKKLIPYLLDDRTSFFSNPAQFEVLTSGLLPDLTLRREERRLVLVSAGCSTGEEAYSLAMVARESGLVHKNWRVDLFGVDINHEALETAQAGLYPASALSRLAPSRIQRWFRRSGGRFMVRDELKEMISWGPFNLAAEDPWPWPELKGRVDVLMIRNVLLGLSPMAGKKATAHLAEVLAPGGVLLMGPVEGLPHGAKQFEAERWGGVMYWRRLAEKLKANPGHPSRKSRRGLDPVSKDQDRASEPRPLPKRITAELKKSSQIMAQGRPDQAWPGLEAVLNKTAQKGEYCPEALGLAVRGHLVSGRWAEARDLAERIISLTEDRVWTHLLLSEAWAGEDQIVRARSEWTHAAEMMTRTPDWKNDPYWRLDPVYGQADPAELVRRRLADRSDDKG